MEIKVLLFGPQATLAGKREVLVEVAENEPTAAQVLAAVADAVPNLVGSIATSRLAVNHEFASAETVVSPEDEVALIGMVSGG